MNLHRIEKGGQSNFEYKSFVPEKNLGFVPEKNLEILPLSVKDDFPEGTSIYSRIN